MIEVIHLGTARYYRMRGLLHPALNEQTPDNEVLLAPATLVRKTIKHYFVLWDIKLERSSFLIEDLSLTELEKLMKLITITIILFNSTSNQGLWFKSARKELNNLSLKDLVFSHDFDQALNYAKSVLI